MAQRSGTWMKATQPKQTSTPSHTHSSHEDSAWDGVLCDEEGNLIVIDRAVLARAMSRKDSRCPASKPLGDGKYGLAKPWSSRRPTTECRCRAGLRRGHTTMVLYRGVAAVQLNFVDGSQSVCVVSTHRTVTSERPESRSEGTTSQLRARIEKLSPIVYSFPPLFSIIRCDSSDGLAYLTSESLDYTKTASVDMLLDGAYI
ncbi:hypothetical protein BKA63DRAFT_282769 [Paraphoma chrysanthemicola]|nr:hypothetical protein BKA63DRAFT_282769 [Paraphoma chrysanthemicola]